MIPGICLCLAFSERTLSAATLWPDPFAFSAGSAAWGSLTRRITDIQVSPHVFHQPRHVSEVCFFSL